MFFIQLTCAKQEFLEREGKNEIRIKELFNKLLGQHKNGGRKFEESVGRVEEEGYIFPEQAAACARACCQVKYFPP